MRKFIAKTIGYSLQDYKAKTSILDTLKFLRESQFWDEQKIRDYQSMKLRRLIDHAYHKVPYYHDLFNHHNLKPADIKTIDDIWKIPILTKDILKKENARLIATDTNWKQVKKGKTGGTTGVPAIVYKDSANRSFTWASYYRWFEWMGIHYYDKKATFWGARTVTSRSRKQEIQDSFRCIIQNELRINSFELSEEAMLNAYKQINKFEPLLLKGYLSALLDFAAFIEKNKLIINSPKALSTTTETLLPHHRIYLQSIFNAPVYDQYGCGELSAIAYECSAHKGLHVNMEHILCEILDQDNKPVFDISGKLVGTDLDNFVMPFIRYENGDLATLSSEKCSCGVNQPLIKSIDGRTADVIVLNTGQKVHGVFITDILYELGIFSDKIRRFQVIQSKIGEIDFKLETDQPLEDNQQIILLKSLKNFFIKVNYSEHKILPNEANGKFKYIINNIND